MLIRTEVDDEMNEYKKKIRNPARGLSKLYGQLTFGKKKEISKQVRLSTHVTNVQTFGGLLSTHSLNLDQAQSVYRKLALHTGSHQA